MPELWPDYDIVDVVVIVIVFGVLGLTGAPRFWRWLLKKAAAMDKESQHD